ncbi:MAG TPA: L,D-transpeptidase [Solirubrobacteraceae bacterium]|nr:L,D-transpeptidase [Solirubrobacteraceae bacterium]
MPRAEPTDQRPARRLTSWRALWAAFAVLVPLVPVLVALFLHGGASRAASVRTTRSAAFNPVPGAGAAHPAAKRRSRRSGRALPPGPGALIGYVSRPMALRVRPGGRAIAELRTRTGFGSPTYVLVRRVRGRWLGVVATAAGNNRIGWVRAAGVELARDAWSIHAHLARHQLDIYRDGKLVEHFLIATGKPSAPTPTGLFAVTDRLTTGDPQGPYGCCILALSAKAPHKISGWNGGNRIAIHSTPETSSIGYSVSHGCMRLTLADGEWLIRHIPLATPVRVSSA